MDTTCAEVKHTRRRHLSISPFDLAYYGATLESASSTSIFAVRARTARAYTYDT